jgi:hypothetical protein
MDTATGGLYVTITSHVVVRGQINSFCFSCTLVVSVEPPTKGPLAWISFNPPTPYDAQEQPNTIEAETPKR